jgi:hypothetical protein
MNISGFGILCKISTTGFTYRRVFDKMIRRMFLEIEMRKAAPRRTRTEIETAIKALRKDYKEAYEKWRAAKKRQSREKHPEVESREARSE